MGRKITIIKDGQGAPNGIDIKDYTVGEEFETGTITMPEDYASELIKAGIAAEAGATDAGASKSGKSTKASEGGQQPQGSKE